MSAKILINTTQVNSVIEEFEQQRTQLIKLRSSVSNIKSNCGISGSQKASIQKSLSSVMSSMEKQSDSMKTMGSTLSSIVTLYKDTEAGLSGQSDTGAVNVGGSDSSGSSESTDDSGSSISWSWSDTWKVVGSAGVAGGLISAFGSLITGDGDAKTKINFAKYLVKATGAAASYFSKGSSSYLFGLNSGLSGIDTSSFGSMFSSSWAKQFTSDLKLSGAQTTAENVKAFTKWGGYILTVAGNVVDNYDEYSSGKISSGRAVAETVIESGVDIALGAAATATATAVVGAAAAGIGAALGVTVAAPAVVVGVASVGIVWGVNSVCKWITGVDVGEAAADLVCDFVTDPGQTVKNVANAAVEKGKAAVEAVGSAVDSAVSTVTNWGKSLFGF